jgi:hypothetical protein
VARSEKTLEKELHQTRSRGSSGLEEEEEMDGIRLSEATSRRYEIHEVEEVDGGEMEADNG